MDPVQRFRQLVKAGEKAFYDGDAEAYETATRLAAKILRDLAQADQLDAVLSLEPEWYNRPVKKVEKEEHYHRCFSWHKDAFWEAGKRAKNRSPLASVHPVSDGVTKIAFVCNAPALSAQVRPLKHVLRRWLAVLKPGGWLVLETPNLISACKAVLENPLKAARAGKTGQMSMWPLYGDPSWRDPLMMHKWLHTPQSLGEVMHEAGFAQIKQVPAQFKMREPRDMRLVGAKPELSGESGSLRGVA